jgi:hypothetical protein
MPFDEEENESASPQSQKIGLKNISSQKSIFDDLPQKTTQSQFEESVKVVQKRKSVYKEQASDLALKFNKLISDKTLAENRNVFQKEMEKEILTDMASLAIKINNDIAEEEGMGTLSWTILLLKTCLSQRDKINNLEYSLFKLNKEVSALVDVSKKSE